MAYGVGENPRESVDPHLESVDFPATRTDIVQAAEDGAAPAELINVLKRLPAERYDTMEDVRRDLGEAARRSMVAPDQQEDRERDIRDIGRKAAEERGKHP